MSGWLYYRIIHWAIVEYGIAGYELSGTRPDGIDAVLSRGNEVVLVQLKGWNRNTRPVAEAVRGSITGDARVDLLWQPNTYLVSMSEIEARVEVARSMSERFPPAALVFGYAALEPVLIQLASASSDFRPPFDHHAAAGLLHDNGVLGSDEYAFLTECWQLRNRIAHPRGNDQLSNIDASAAGALLDLIQRLCRHQDFEAVHLLDETLRSRTIRTVRGATDLLRSWISDSDASESIKSRAVGIVDEVRM